MKPVMLQTHLRKFTSKFLTLFSQDNDSMPRVWTGNENIRAITKTASSASLKLLLVMAAIHLDDTATDNIESALSLALLDPKAADSTKKKSSGDPLTSSTWDKVPPFKTLFNSSLV